MAAQSPKIDEIIEGVHKLTADDTQKAKSILNDLGTLQEASRSANQLMGQKSELESRIGIVGQYLITEHMYLQVNRTHLTDCSAYIDLSNVTLFSYLTVCP